MADNDNDETREGYHKDDNGSWTANPFNSTDAQTLATAAGTTQTVIQADYAATSADGIAKLKLIAAFIRSLQ